MTFKENLDKSMEILKEFNISTIYLFGSASRNELRAESDIDIAFLGDEDIDEYRCFIKAQEIADILKRDVDLIDLKKASTVFRAQIIGHGRVIFCNDNVKRACFEMRSFKEYALLNEERGEILKNIEKSGSVYGKGRSIQ